MASTWYIENNMAQRVNWLQVLQCKKKQLECCNWIYCIKCWDNCSVVLVVSLYSFLCYCINYYVTGV